MSGLILLIVGYGVWIHVKMEQSVYQKVDASISCLLILGAQLKTNEATLTLRSRLKKGAQLLHANPELKVIVTGGKGTDVLFPEAIIMRDILILEYGIDPDRIIVEDKAHNTFENLLLSKPLLLPGVVGIVTNEFHTVRTGFLAKRLKIEASLFGAKTPLKKRFKWQLREYAAMVKSLCVDRVKDELMASVSEEM
ncbi:MAG: YdcF family protein [Turicibacter sp.]